MDPFCRAEYERGTRHLLRRTSVVCPARFCSERHALHACRMIHGEGLCLTRIQSENASGNRTIGCSVQSDDGYGAPNNTINRVRCQFYLKRIRAELGGWSSLPALQGPTPQSVSMPSKSAEVHPSWGFNSPSRHQHKDRVGRGLQPSEAIWTEPPQIVSGKIVVTPL